MKTIHRILILAATLTGEPAVSTAQTENEHPKLNVEVGTTLMATANNENAAGDEGGMGFDLFTSLPVGRGSWGLLLEAETHNMADHLSRQGGDFQSHEPFRSGEAAVAEFHYTFPALGGEWSVGLLDSKVHIDGSEVANDDKEQFLGAAFVNNPSIAIPENDLGLAYRREALQHIPGFTLLAMTSEFKRVDSNRSARGLFVAAEAFKPVGPLLARLGAWSRHTSLPIRGGIEREGSESGIFVSLDGHTSGLSWNVRVGKALLARSIEESYFGATLRVPVRQGELGIGLGHSVRDGAALSGGQGSSDYLELFYRFIAFRRVIITPDIHYERTKGIHGGENVVTACVRFRVVS